MPEDDLYLETTQLKTWSFGPTALSKIRTNTNIAGKKFVTNRWRRLRAEAIELRASGELPLTEPPSSSSTPIPNNSTPSSTPIPSQTTSTIDPSLVPDPETLTPAEESTLLRYYTIKLLELSDVFQFPSNVKATACTFLSRFYLHHSVHLYHPKILIPTILFISTKSENHYIPLSDFIKRTPWTTSEQLLSHEFTVAGGVGWDLDVKHPLRAADGGFMELRTALLNPSPKEASIDPELAKLRELLGSTPTSTSSAIRRVDDAYGRMKNYLTKEVLVSDVYYHFTPPQIFLGALWLADKELAEGYINWRFGEGATMGRVAVKKKKRGKKDVKIEETNGAAAGVEETSRAPALAERLVGVVERCAGMITEAKDSFGLTVKDVKPIDKKLFRCTNPVKFLVGDKAQAAYGTEIGMGSLKKVLEKVEAEKKKKEKKKGLADDDPFGDAMPVKKKDDGGGMFGGALPGKE